MGVMVLAEGLTGYEWQDDASCQGLEFKLEIGENPFFVETEGRGARYDKARVYCMGCPVVVDCLIDGIEDRHGFRGGCTKGERSIIRKQMNAGVDFRRAVENIWAAHRLRNVSAKFLSHRVKQVPPKSIWQEWEIG